MEQGIETFRRLMDTAPDAMVIVDDKGSIAFVNIQTEKLFGYSRDALIGQPVEILIPERFRPSHVGHRSGFVASPNVRPMGSGLELFGRHRDGSEFPVEISLGPVHSEQGMLVSAAIRDITERKRMEAAVRHADIYLRSALESIPGSFALFDQEDKLVVCNSVYAEMFGRAIQGPIVGRTYEALMDAGLTTDTFDLGAESPVAFRARWLAYHQDPTGPFDLRAKDGSSLRITDRRTAEEGTVMTIWDTTEDVQREDELRKMRELAEAASAAKSEFLASMSHELRTPLNAILGFAQLLQRDKKTPLSDRQQERLQHVLKGGEHLLRLIDDILDLARIEAGRVTISPEPVDVAEVLMEVNTTLQPMAARADIGLSVNPVPAGLPRIFGDRTRVSQILINYGSNAIKYGRKGGIATFTVSVPTSAFVCVTVTDDGIGIPESKQDKIFQPFQRAGQETGPVEGTGIGLAIAKRLADIMGGSVGFRSTHGKGSEFWIELPVHEVDTTMAAEKPATFPEASSLTGPDGPSYVIVYVEDNPSNIAFMKALIADYERVQLLTAPSAEIGIELVRAHRPHVVIMDINLPGMNGIEAARRLQEIPETCDIPVVALSAAAMPRDAQRAASAGFYRYLTKPVKVAELTAVLEALLMPGTRSVPAPGAD